MVPAAKGDTRLVVRATLGGSSRLQKIHLSVRLINRINRPTYKTDSLKKSAVVQRGGHVVPASGQVVPAAKGDTRLVIRPDLLDRQPKHLGLRDVRKCSIG